jgi:hypothetical protein
MYGIEFGDHGRFLWLMFRDYILKARVDKITLPCVLKINGARLF